MTTEAQPPQIPQTDGKTGGQQANEHFREGRFLGQPHMNHSPIGSTPITSNVHLLLAYVADLELEVDRLRKQGQFVQHEVRATLKRIHMLCTDAAETEYPPP